eukprot:COSAG05_NODE_17612_length_322_cov_1.156951_1_plen_20_part_10
MKRKYLSHIAQLHGNDDGAG